ncbi:uncharacterized protein B0J16DRAFT_317802 [Fusarium flagelliforme]|uniref:uncharacterized protein n=1 Tax=Fusarium flagelliforme TaxID=2675880 RepID=UPI001E8D1ECF|nr:uncharacterized protein B0J16DRAFT_317802 [Fusarium flagelliforme]KAH7188132.1 hypothetical protein B0J16DRAFT_317802 [Fusarium flagelliforme]
MPRNNTLPSVTPGYGLNMSTFATAPVQPQTTSYEVATRSLLQSHFSKETAKPLILGMQELHTLVKIATHEFGLFTAIVGDDTRRIVVGRSLGEVQGLAETVAYPFGRGERARKMAWLEAMGEHYEYLSDKPGGRFQGSYIIKCDELQFRNDYEHGEMQRLDIFERDEVACANIELGEMDGVMLLSTNDSALDALEHSYDPNVMLRKCGSKTCTAPQPEWSPSTDRRFFFRLRGKEIASGETVSEPECGDIEFLDDEFTKFVGRIKVPFMGREVEFRGFKVSDTPRDQPCDWEYFSFEEPVNSRRFEHGAEGEFE